MRPVPRRFETGTALPVLAGFHPLVVSRFREFGGSGPITIQQIAIASRWPPIRAESFFYSRSSIATHGVIDQMLAISNVEKDSGKPSSDQRPGRREASPSLRSVVARRCWNSRQWLVLALGV